MESEQPESLIERVSRLEKELEELKTAFTALHVEAAKPTAEPIPEPDPEPEIERVRTFRVVEKSVTTLDVIWSVVVAYEYRLCSITTTLFVHANDAL